MEKQRMCVLDEKKVCDDCGECNRCDLDPNKICDNCCRCIAMEDEGSEFRSRTVSLERSFGDEKGNVAPLYKRSAPKRPEPAPFDPENEPLELTPDIVDYWEKILIEHGEAPADDGFGEIEVNTKIPVYGKRKAADRKKH